MIKLGKICGIVNDMTATLNLLVQQGATLETSLQLSHALTVTVAFKAGGSLLYTSPLPVSIASGAILTFGSSLLVLSAAAAVGSTSLSISPYSGSTIPVGSIANIAARDLTGFTARGMIRKNYKDSTPLATLSFLITPSTGLINMSLGSGATSLIAPNAIYSDLPADVRLISSSDVSLAIWAAAYYWDVELILTSGVVERLVNGRCWCTSEATR